MHNGCQDDHSALELLDRNHRVCIVHIPNHLDTQAPAMTMQDGTWASPYTMPAPAITNEELLQHQKAAEAAGYLDPLQHMRMRLMSATNSGDQGVSTTVAASSPASRGMSSEDDAAAARQGRARGNGNKGKCCGMCSGFSLCVF